MAEIFNQSEQLSNSIKKKNDLNLELWPVNALRLEQGWGQVQLTKYSSTPSTPNIYQVQVLVKYSFF